MDPKPHTEQQSAMSSSSLYDDYDDEGEYMKEEDVEETVAPRAAPPVRAPAAATPRRSNVDSNSAKVDPFAAILEMDPKPHTEQPSVTSSSSLYDDYDDGSGYGLGERVAPRRAAPPATAPPARARTPAATTPRSTVSYQNNYNHIQDDFVDGLPFQPDEMDNSRYNIKATPQFDAKPPPAAPKVSSHRSTYIPPKVTLPPKPKPTPPVVTVKKEEEPPVTPKPQNPPVVSAKTEEPLVILETQTLTREDKPISVEVTPQSPQPKPLATAERPPEIWQMSVAEVETKIEELTADIYQENKGKKFNIKSNKQAALAIFGDEKQSTSKDILEGIAFRNRMAKLVLEYRACQSQLRKNKKKQEVAGRTVQSATKVARETKPFGSVMESTDSSNLEEIETDSLLLVDVSALIHRFYHAIRPMHRLDGDPVSAVYGVCSTLNQLLLHPEMKEPHDPSEMPRIVLVFDSKEEKTFRHELYPRYKANRKETPMDLIPQFDFVRQAAVAYGLCQMEAPGYEADDVIATLASWASTGGNKTTKGPLMDTNILSGDKDLWQLVTDAGQVPSVHMIDPKTKERITHEQVFDSWKVPPNQLGEVLALAGDKADNIPGVPKIGPKIAAELIQKYGTVENLLENTHTVKQKKRRENLEEFASQARLSRSLVELERNVPLKKLRITRPSSPGEKIASVSGDAVEVSNIAEVMDTLRMEPIDSQRVLQFYDEMGFKMFKTQFNNLKGASSTPRIKKRTTGVNAPEQPAPISLTGESSPDTPPPKPQKRTYSKWAKRPPATIPKPEDYEDVPF